MKLSARDAARLLAAPGPATPAVLLYGPDAMRVALKRQALVAALIGPAGAAEMRLTRLPAADLRRDPAALIDAVKATGFFPGARAVLVEEAADAATPALAAALADWRRGDAQVVVTAGDLRPANTLRKLFEAHPAAAAIGVYTDPPRRDEIEAEVVRAGLARVSREAMGDIEALARQLDPGDFIQFLAKLALYHGGAGELVPADVAACAPPAPGVELDAVLDLAAEGRLAELAVELRRLGRGGGPTALTIAAARHFRTLHAAASAGGDPEAALGRLRPPPAWARRRRMADQVRRLGPGNAERALALVMEAELALRSDRPVPATALVERLMVRIATLRER